MSQVLSPTNHVLEAARKYHCHVPLSSIKNCQYTYCTPNANDDIAEPQSIHLEKLDKYWAELLRAQANSSANYIYRIQNYGSAYDPTLVKKETFVPVDVINQRVLEMANTGGLLKAELFYLLSFVLNLMKLPAQRQEEYMVYMLNRNLLDEEILTYLQIVSRHPNAGLTNKQLEEFQQILQKLIVKSQNKINYYNPDNIFLKTVYESNPYELEYLNVILRCKKMLTTQQTIYFTKFVAKLQELDKSTREQYLCLLRENDILPFQRFESLIVFLVARAKRVKRSKLRNLLRELQALMNIADCPVPEPETAAVKTKKPTIKAIDVDYFRIDKSLSSLMKSVIPNIVSLTNLKNFLTNMMALSQNEVINIFNGLKIANVMTKQRFNFLEDFIKSGHLSKVDKAKRENFIELLKKVVDSPVNTGVIVNAHIPASKGPIKEKIDIKEKVNSQATGDTTNANEVTSKTTEEVEKPSTDSAAKNAEQTKEQNNKNGKVNKKSKKEVKKKPKKSAKRGRRK